MNLSDQITEILKDNIVQVTTGMNDKKEIWAVALQLVDTGPGCQMEIKHNVNCGSVVDCVNQIKKQVDHANEMKSLVITRKSR